MKTSLNKSFEGDRDPVDAGLDTFSEDVSEHLHALKHTSGWLIFIHALYSTSSEIS